MKNELVFNKSVKNKQVAFVGMAPNIKGKGLGSEIDSFDVVIRTNIYPIPVEWQKDYGTKCDILALHLKNTDNDYDVKNIITYREVKQKKENNYILMTQNDRMTVSNAIQNVIGVHPIYATNGINMMYFSLEGGCSSFKFYGITGYQNKEGEVVEHHEAQHYVFRMKGGHKKSMRKHPNHNFQVLNDYLRYMLKQGKIEMDQYSLKYFNNG